MRKTLLIAFVFAVTAALSNVTAQENIACGLGVVVIDAGHGGEKFPGAHYRGVYEKDLNLKIALRLGKLIEQTMPEVKVVYTRKTDKQFSTSLTEDLQARADIANKADGDLFISIHTNAARTSSARGVETLIMGEGSLETRLNENVLYANNKEEFIDMSNEKTAAIVRAYIQNLQFTYGEYSEAMARIIQKNYAKAGRVNRGVKPQLLKVLYATDMPGVLTEIGFLSNPDEYKYMCSEKGQNEIAQCLLNAVKEYAQYVRGTVLVDESATGGADLQDGSDKEPIAQQVEAKDKEQAAASDKKSNAVTAKSDAGKVVPKHDAGYAIQVVASIEKISPSSSKFGRYASEVGMFVADGKFKYKYCVGRFADRAAAAARLGEIRKEFADAFIVRFDGDRIVK